MTDKPNEDILKQKEALAKDSLELAQSALAGLQNVLSEASARDLVSIFSSAIKVHRDIVADILDLTVKESDSEKALGRDYEGTVDALLRKVREK